MKNKFNIGGKVQGYIENNRIYFDGTNEAGDLMLFPWWPRLKNIYKFFREHQNEFENLFKYLQEYDNIIINGFSLGGVFAIYFYLFFVKVFNVTIILDDPLRCLSKSKLKTLYTFINFGLKIITYKKGNCIAHHWPPKIFGYKDYPGEVIKVKYKYKNFWEWLISPLTDHTRSVNGGIE